MNITRLCSKRMRQETPKRAWRAKFKENLPCH
jgi:hypothetical protein